jgi:hypothetical protein
MSQSQPGPSSSSASFAVNSASLTAGSDNIEMTSIPMQDAIQNAHTSSLLEDMKRLPNFRKGFLTPAMSVELVKRFSNRASVILDKITAAEKVLRAASSSPAVGYWGTFVFSNGRASISNHARDLFQLECHTSYNQKVINEKTTLINTLRVELNTGLFSDLSIEIQANLTAIDSSPSMNENVKSHLHFLLNKTIDEVKMNIDIYRTNAEINKLNLSAKVSKKEKSNFVLFFDAQFSLITDLFSPFSIETIERKEGKGKERDSFSLYQHQDPDQPSSKTIWDIETEEEYILNFDSKRHLQDCKRPAYSDTEESDQQEILPKRRKSEQQVSRVIEERKQRFQQRKGQPIQEKNPKQRQGGRPLITSVNNISSIDYIPPNISNLLNKGINFNLHLKPDLLDFRKKLKLHNDNLTKIYFKNNRHKEFQIMLEANSVKLVQQVKKLSKNNPHRKLLPIIKITKDFMFENNLLIIPSDKNLGLTLTDKSWYLEQGRILLSNPNHYQVINISIDNNFLKTLILPLEGLGKIHRQPRKLQSELWKIYRQLKININNGQYSVPTMYLLPKIHKDPPTSRPIVPSYPWITHTVSQFCDRELQKFFKFFPQELKDTPSLLRKINDFNETGHLIPLYLVAFDVINMYGNIDYNEAAGQMRFYFTNKLANDAPLLAEFRLLLDLTIWVNKNCYLRFSDLIYQQVSGIAMGTPVAPTFARLFACVVETLSFDNHKKLLEPFSFLVVPDLYNKKVKKNRLCFRKIELNLLLLRYVDDGFCVVAITKNDLKHKYKLVNFKKDFDYNLFNSTQIQNYLHAIYSICHSLRITIDIGQSVPILDITVSIQGTSLQTTSFDKPINKHLYTDPSSYYPDRYIYNWINGENQRLIRNNSDISSFENAQSAFIEHLLHRNYPKNIISKQLDLHSFEERDDLLYPRVQRKVDKELPFLVIQENFPGRHIVENFGRQLVKYTPLHSTKNVTWVTKKGTTILNVLNKFNRKSLRSNSMLARI